MKKVDAAESSFAEANRYYLFAWLFLFIFALTAFVEKRAVNREMDGAGGEAERLHQIALAAETTAGQLRLRLIDQYGDVDEEGSLRRLYADAFAAQASIDNLSLRLGAATWLTFEERLEINADVNYLRAMFYFNSPFHQPTAEGEPSLTALVETDYSTIVPAPQISLLSFENVIRLSWLATLQPAHVLKRLSPFRSVVLTREQLPALTASLDEAAKTAANPSVKDVRGKYQDYWRRWLVDDSSRGATAAQLRYRTLTVEGLSAAYLSALERDSELAGRASGRSAVSLPGLPVKLSLSDGLLALPMVLVLSSSAMLVYLLRGVKLVPATIAEAEVVGKLPVYFAVYGLSGVRRAVGRASTICLILLPHVAAALLPLYLFSFTSQEWLLIYYGTLVLGLLLSAFCIRAADQVLRLIDEGLARE